MKLLNSSGREIVTAGAQDHWQLEEFGVSLAIADVKLKVLDAALTVGGGEVCLVAFVAFDDLILGLLDAFSSVAPHEI